MASILKAFDLNDALIKINPERNGAAYAIGFKFDENKNFVATYNKGEVSKEIGTISNDMFESMTVDYLAHTLSAAVEMAY